MRSGTALVFGMLAAGAAACATNGGDSVGDNRGDDVGAVAARESAAVTFATVDSAALVQRVYDLAADSMEGRAAGTDGGARARRYLLQEFQRAGLQPIGGSFERPFTFRVGQDTGTYAGVNLVGLVRGTQHPNEYIVVTAHYDHLGIRNGIVYNGADDNASGTSALLAIAHDLARQPPAHSVLIVAFDAEERGLRGARAFVAEPPVPAAALRLNLNMDMVSRSEAGELYVAGTYHYPMLLPVVERVAAAAPVRLIPGHDRPGLPAGDDWTSASDHGPFHAAGIPFLYFGVEDHPGYHQPTDDADEITPGFYVGAVKTILAVLRLADSEL